MGKMDGSAALVIVDKDEQNLIVKNAEFRSKLDYEFFANFESPHTKKCYRRDINQFFEFVRDNFPEVNQLSHIERVHVVAFKNWLTDNDYAPKTINRKLSANSSYFDFLVEKGLGNFNPCSCIKRPRQEVITPTNDLSDEQILKLFEALNEDSPSAPLHRAVIYILFSTGIRKSELINLKRKDYKTVNEHKIIEVRAKGGKYLAKVMHPNCVEILENYLRWMESMDRKVEYNDWLLQPTKNPTDNGNLERPLAPTTIDYIIHRYCQKAGIESRISPHSARASYIGSALENGQDLFRVSQDVGHASVKTTQEYNKRRQKLNDSPAYGLGFFKKE